MNIQLIRTICKFLQAPSYDKGATQTYPNTNSLRIDFCSVLSICESIGPIGNLLRRNNLKSGCINSSI